MRRLLRALASIAGLGGALLLLDAHEAYGLAAISVCMGAAICSAVATPAR